MKAELDSLKIVGIEEETELMKLTIAISSPHHPIITIN